MFIITIKTVVIIMLIMIITIIIFSQQRLQTILL